MEDPQKLQEINTNKKPYVNKRIFWDVNIEKLDFDRDKLFIVERALVKGTEEDEFAVYAYYGKENMKDILLEVEYLDSITIEYVSQIFKIQKEKMKCYINPASTDEIKNTIYDHVQKYNTGHEKIEVL